MDRLTKSDIEPLRRLEGFPVARDEDIIALSDAPAYTACPNPFLGDFIRENGTPYDETTDDYHREPLAADVSEGKNDPIYNAHGYHTKVPHKAIMRYILHYTKPGDLVFDGFCGTGMTGVAAWMCGFPDAAFRARLESDMPGVAWGVRKAILSDLSPAAAFIAHNYNTPVDVAAFWREANRILDQLEEEYGWMYETRHAMDGEPTAVGRIHYTVWSDVFICPTCSREMVFWDVAVERGSGKVKDRFTCPRCGSNLKKTDCARARETRVDSGRNEMISITKQTPVWIHYSVGAKRFEKKPDEHDIATIERVEAMEIPYWYPTDRMCEGGEGRRNDRYGMTRVHHFYTRRSLMAIAFIYHQLRKIELPLRNTLLFTFEQILLGMSKIARYVPSHYSQVNQYLSGTLYVGSQVVEVTPRYILENKIKLLTKVFSMTRNSRGNIAVSTMSLSNCLLPDNSIDYIFTDPPFGGNLNYSELSFLWEAWLKAVTNQKAEAVISAAHGKGLPEYQSIMTRCFAEYYRVLKPARWMTVEFHNSKNAVWNAIQEALQRVGFIIADVRTLDKQHSTFKQVTTTSAVKQDLVISAYKPKDSFRRAFVAQAGREDEETAWAFVRQHLEKLPVVAVKHNRVEALSERQDFLLFDRMVAYHIVNGMSVPLDAADFYRGLDEKFLKRDGMYFLPDQVNEYDAARLVNEIEPSQTELYISNEKTAVRWLYQQLSAAPQTYAEIQPKFMREGKAIDKFEAMPELSVMLDENFLPDEKGRWYVPDATKAGDVAKLREKKLLKEFDGYLAVKGPIKQFRTEAIRVGFAKLWASKDYKRIAETAGRLPESVLQEDGALLMYYDISLGRL